MILRRIQSYGLKKYEKITPGQNKVWNTKKTRMP